MCLPTPTTPLHLCPTPPPSCPPPRFHFPPPNPQPPPPVTPPQAQAQLLPGAGARIKPGPIRWRLNPDLAPWAPDELATLAAMATAGNGPGVMSRLGNFFTGLFGNKTTPVRGVSGELSPRLGVSPRVGSLIAPRMSSLLAPRSGSITMLGSAIMGGIRSAVTLGKSSPSASAAASPRGLRVSASGGSILRLFGTGASNSSKAQSGHRRLSAMSLSSVDGQELTGVSQGVEMSSPQAPPAVLPDSPGAGSPGAGGVQGWGQGQL